MVKVTGPEETNANSLSIPKRAVDVVIAVGVVDLERHAEGDAVVGLAHGVDLDADVVVQARLVRIGRVRADRAVVSQTRCRRRYRFRRSPRWRCPGPGRMPRRPRRPGRWWRRELSSFFPSCVQGSSQSGAPDAMGGECTLGGSVGKRWRRARTNTSPSDARLPQGVCVTPRHPRAAPPPPRPGAGTLPPCRGADGRLRRRTRVVRSGPWLSSPPGFWCSPRRRSP